MVAGHTHWRCDHMFSLISRKIQGQVSGLLSYGDLVYLLRWVDPQDPESVKLAPPVWEFKMPPQISPDDPEPHVEPDPFEEACGKAPRNEEVEHPLRAHAPGDRMRAYNTNLQQPNTVVGVFESWDLAAWFKSLLCTSRTDAFERHVLFAPTTQTAGVLISKAHRFEFSRRVHHSNARHVRMRMDRSSFSTEERLMLARLPGLS